MQSLLSSLVLCPRLFSAQDGIRDNGDNVEITLEITSRMTHYIKCHETSPQHAVIYFTPFNNRLEPHPSKDGQAASSPSAISTAHLVMYSSGCCNTSPCSFFSQAASRWNPWQWLMGAGCFHIDLGLVLGALVMTPVGDCLVFRLAFRVASP